MGKHEPYKLQETVNRKKFIQNGGYRATEQCKSLWNQKIEGDCEIRQFVPKFDRLTSKPTIFLQSFSNFSQIFLKAVLKGKSYGFAQIDIYVPDIVKDFSEERQPFSKYTTVLY